MSTTTQRTVFQHTTFHRTGARTTSGQPPHGADDPTVRMPGTPPPTLTLPTGPGRRPDPERPRAGRPTWLTPARLLSAAVALGLVASLLMHAHLSAWGPTTGTAAGPTPEAANTLSIFIVAVWFWIFSGLDDTYIALAAGISVVLLGALSTEELFNAFGHESVWLLVAAFVLAKGVGSTGLAARGAAFVITAAGTPRSLAHLTTLALVVTAFVVPSTSGRAALTLPIFLALRQALRSPSTQDSLPARDSDHGPAITKMLAVLFPSVILLSAVGSYLGAGAHLITSQVLQSSGHRGFDFAGWLILGLPLAIVSSHVCAELVLLLFTDRADRRVRLQVRVSDLEQSTGRSLRGPLSTTDRRCLALIAAVVLLWCTQPLHGLHPAIVALLGALAVCAPGFGPVRLPEAIRSVPWALLIFMATTLALASALVSSGAADWLGGTVLHRTGGADSTAPWIYLAVVVTMSAAAHLVIVSRSARSAVLIPLVIASAPTVGVDPVGAALASTAAAGFCHSLTGSAKPVTIFSVCEGEPTYDSRDLLRLSAWLGPITVLLVFAFSAFVWPHLGVPILAGG